MAEQYSWISANNEGYSAGKFSDVDGNIMPWSRSTVADGKWLNKEMILPFSGRDQYLLDSLNQTYDECSAFSGHLNEEIRIINARADVIDVVGSHDAFTARSAELVSGVDISDRDVIKILNDVGTDIPVWVYNTESNVYVESTVSPSNQQTYYRWLSAVNDGPSGWEYVGDLEPYYKDIDLTENSITFENTAPERNYTVNTDTDKYIQMLVDGRTGTIGLTDDFISSASQCYTALTSHSASWDETSATLNENSGYWDQAYTALTSHSASWDETSATLNENSGYWDQAYTAVTSHSGLWNEISAFQLSAKTDNFDQAFTYSGFVLSGGAGVNFAKADNTLTVSVDPLPAHTTSDKNKVLSVSGDNGELGWTDIKTSGDGNLLTDLTNEDGDHIFQKGYIGSVNYVNLADYPDVTTEYGSLQDCSVKILECDVQEEGEVASCLFTLGISYNLNDYYRKNCSEILCRATVVGNKLAVQVIQYYGDDDLHNYFDYLKYTVDSNKISLWLVQKYNYTTSSTCSISVGISQNGEDICKFRPNFDIKKTADISFTDTVVYISKVMGYFERTKFKHTSRISSIDQNSYASTQALANFIPTRQIPVTNSTRQGTGKYCVIGNFRQSMSNYYTLNLKMRITVVTNSTGRICSGIFHYAHRSYSDSAYTPVGWWSDVKMPTDSTGTLKSVHVLDNKTVYIEMTTPTGNDNTTVYVEILENLDIQKDSVGHVYYGDGLVLTMTNWDEDPSIHTVNLINDAPTGTNDVEYLLSAPDTFNAIDTANNLNTTFAYSGLSISAGDGIGFYKDNNTLAISAQAGIPDGTLTYKMMYGPGGNPYVQDFNISSLNISNYRTTQNTDYINLNVTASNGATASFALWPEDTSLTGLPVPATLIPIVDPTNIKQKIYMKVADLNIGNYVSAGDNQKLTIMSAENLTLANMQPGVIYLV